MDYAQHTTTQVCTLLSSILIPPGLLKTETFYNPKGRCCSNRIWQIDFSTSKNHWPAFRERISVQLKKEASSYCLAGKILRTSVVRLKVWSRIRKGTPSTLEEITWSFFTTSIMI